jgi:hypothetical protein
LRCYAAAHHCQLPVLLHLLPCWNLHRLLLLHHFVPGRYAAAAQAAPP